MILEGLRRRRRKKKIHRLSKACDTITSHVDSLLGDARLLHDNHRYERAAAISILALEEAAKAAWVFAAETSALADKHFDWGVVNWATRKHDLKLRVLFTLVRYLNERGWGGSVPHRLKEFESINVEKLVDKMNKIKQAAFYVPLASGAIGAKFSIDEQVSLSALTMATRSADLIRVLRSVRQEVLAKRGPEEKASSD